ncbi:MAG TPA: alpha/beta fold hydrolase [Candidatus Binatia bacterium]|nr:alpha/beta fold hydrolase [Candidatus Binatia bacterium]
MVLLHGFLGSARNLATLARALAGSDPGLGVVALDLTGHGESPPLPPGADSATLAADVLATARGLGLPEPLALVGHSLGGRVALRAGLLEPAALASVTLLDVAPGPLHDAGVAAVVDALRRAPDAVATRGQARAHLVAAGIPVATAEWLTLNLEPADGGYRWRVDREALARLHARIAPEDLWPSVEARRAYSVRCVRGGASGYVGEADARRLEAAGCPVVTLRDADHFLHAERPRETAAAVLAGLRG